MGSWDRIVASYPADGKAAAGTTTTGDDFLLDKREQRERLIKLNLEINERLRNKAKLTPTQFRDLSKRYHENCMELSKLNKLLRRKDFRTEMFFRIAARRLLPKETIAKIEELAIEIMEERGGKEATQEEMNGCNSETP